MPREPVTLTGEQEAEVATLVAVQTAGPVADHFAIARRSFYRLTERDSAAAARWPRGKARAVGVIAQGDTVIDVSARGDAAPDDLFDLMRRHRDPEQGLLPDVTGGAA